MLNEMMLFEDLLYRENSVTFFLPQLNMIVDFFKFILF